MRAPGSLSGGLALALLLWVAATLFYGGDLGKWDGEWANHYRDPVTGHFDFPQLPGQIFRPVSNTVLVYNLNTLLWDLDWLRHLLSAVAHGIVAMLLWRLLRRLLRSHFAAEAGTLLFLVAPAGYQAVLWTTQIGNEIATGLFLLLALLVVRAAAAPQRWGPVIGAGLVAFAIPFAWEQQASGVLALPLLYCAASRAEPSRRRRAARALGIGALCTSAVGAYAALAVTQTSSGARGGRGSFVADGEELARRIQQVTGQARRSLLMEEWLGGALATGWGALLGHPLMALGLVLALVTAVRIWWRHSLRLPTGAGDKLAAPAPVRRWLGVTGFGIAAFVVAWLMVMVVRNQSVVSRLCYYPTLLAIIAVCPALDATTWWAARSPARRRIVLSVGVSLVTALVVTGALAMIGIQTLYRERYVLTLSQAEQLRQLVPDPDDGSLFAPLEIRDRAVESSPFHLQFRGPFEAYWTSTIHAQLSYRRKDIAASHFNRWLGLPFEHFDEHGVRVEPSAAGYIKHAIGSGLVDWDHVIPFVIDEEGRVLLVEGVRFERDGDVAIVAPEQVRRAARASGIETVSQTLAPISPDP